MNNQPITINEKPTNHKQNCGICEKPLKKGEHRVKIIIGCSYEGNAVYTYYHPKCFMSRMIFVLQDYV